MFGEVSNCAQLYPVGMNDPKRLDWGTRLGVIAMRSHRMPFSPHAILTAFSTRVVVLDCDNGLERMWSLLNSLPASLLR
jgi:hypothetical protein